MATNLAHQVNRAAAWPRQVSDKSLNCQNAVRAIPFRSRNSYRRSTRKTNSSTPQTGLPHKSHYRPGWPPHVAHQVNRAAAWPRQMSEVLRTPFAPSPFWSRNSYRRSTHKTHSSTPQTGPPHSHQYPPGLPPHLVFQVNRAIKWHSATQFFRRTVRRDRSDRPLTRAEC